MPDKKKEPIGLTEQVSLMKRFLVRSLHYNEANEMQILKQADAAAEGKEKAEK